MTESLLIDALGTVVGIDLAGLDADDSAAVQAAWRDALAPEGSHAATVVAPVLGASRAMMLMRLSQQVTLAALGARRGELWMLHAAGVALPDGRVVVMIGPSGRGKTTVARVLGQVFGYVSDESIGITADGFVVPYRKPLSIIEQNAHPKAERAATDVGLQPLPDAPLRLAAIVLLDRRADGPLEPLVENVDLGEAIEELVLQSSFLADMAAPLQTIAGHAATTGGVLRVTYREAEALRAVLESLAARRPAAVVARPVSSLPSPVHAGETPGERYERAPFVDAVALDDPDRIIVLTRTSGNGTVHMLAGVAPGIWRASSGVDLETLVGAAVEAYGAPDGIDVRQAVASAVAELVDAGVATHHSTD